jgi:spore coat protein CotH
MIYKGYKGYDWNELATHFGLKKHEEDPNDASELIDFLFEVANNFNIELDKHQTVFSDCYEFTDMMVRLNILPGVPVFRALLDLKNELFLEHFALLVPSMCN